MRKKVLARSLMAIICSAALAVPLSGCGGSSSGDTTENGDTAKNGDTTEDAVEISSVEGTVSLPGVAKFEEGDDLASLNRAIRLAGDFLIGTAQAESGTFQGPYWVQLTRVGPDGNVEVVDDSTGDPVSALVSATGQYTLTLPETLDLTADLVLRVVRENVRNPESSNIPLRSVTTGESVDIDPVSEFLVRELERANVNLASLPVNEVVRLRGQIDDLEIAEGTNLENTLDAIGAVAETVVRPDIAELNTPIVSAEQINGEEYTLFLLAKGIGILDGFREVATNFEKDSRLAFFIDDNSTVGASIEGAVMTSGQIREPDPLILPPLNVITDIFGDEEVSGFNLRENGVLSGSFPLEEELADDDFAIRYLPGTFRLQGIPARTSQAPYAFVGVNQETQLFFGRETSVDPQGNFGAIDLDRPRGKREEMMLDLMVHSDGSIPSLQHRYGLVRMTFALGLDDVGHGCSEAGNEAILATRTDGSNFSITNAILRDDAALGTNCDPFEPEHLDNVHVQIEGLSDGRIRISGEPDDEPLEGASDPDGNLWVIGDYNETELDGVKTHTENTLLIGVAVDSTMPSVDNTAWRLLSYDALYDGGFGPTALGGSLGSAVTFCDSGTRLVSDPDRFLDIERDSEGVPVPDASGFGERIVLDAGQNLNVTTAQDGVLTIGYDDEAGLDRIEATGFVSSDGQMMVLAERTLSGGSVSGAGLIIGVRTEDADGAACTD